MYTTPTFITEVLHFVTQVQLLLPTITMNLCLIQCWLTLIGLFSMAHINARLCPFTKNFKKPGVFLVYKLTQVPQHQFSQFCLKVSLSNMYINTVTYLVGHHSYYQPHDYKSLLTSYTYCTLQSQTIHKQINHDL